MYTYALNSYGISVSHSMHLLFAGVVRYPILVMAEGNNDSLSVTPEKNELDSLNTGINSAEYSDSPNDGDYADSSNDGPSTGKSDKRGDSRSKSTEKVEPANREKVPHYLRASTGSCHDLCKYGRKHEFEGKAGTPIRNRIAKMSATEQNGVAKKNAPGFQPSLDIKSVLPKLSSLDRGHVSSRKDVSSGIKTPLAKHKISPCKKTPSPAPPEVIKREISLPSRDLEVPIDHGSLSDNEMLATDRKTGCLRKKHSAVHLKTVKDKMKSPSDSSDGIYGTLRRNSDVMPVKRAAEIKTSAQKATTPLSSISSSKISMSKTSTQPRKARTFVPPPNNQNKMQRTNTETSINEQVPERTLHVTKTRSNAKAPSSSTHTRDVDRSSRKFVLDKNKLVKTGKAPFLTQNANKTPRKSSRMIVSDDKYRSPVKLKFKSGKVVDIQSDNNAPRRLKFRRARINTTNVGVSSVKVVLKHRDVQGRKDAQGLFNNVIEETASKLVQSRKSKVKALVGAFETVISLQDSKPSLHTVKSADD
ncbi:plant calmodulin-binding protein-related isoform 1 [Dorcoceras hygrometricum]|uniref:Plant calmodulin-binding protein-related isoform 1 n=1 Tax=Dorcoceras hygrometricum TaxID=472368 RepID=A0A2Z7C909_9LAMI|nr:plant calmodulin-binding protein-related isoform 1 [Dorcoceras hygrometricum]